MFPFLLWVSSYSLDDFVVELGSALGLWLGLSAISFFDLFAVAAGQLRAMFQTGIETFEL